MVFPTVTLRWSLWPDSGLLWPDGSGSVQAHPQHRGVPEWEARGSTAFLPEQSRRGWGRVWQTGMNSSLVLSLCFMSISWLSLHDTENQEVASLLSLSFCDWLSQRVMMQIVQELCKRPGLNKCGFDMPTIYIPNPNKVSVTLVGVSALFRLTPLLSNLFSTHNYIFCPHSCP